MADRSLGAAETEPDPAWRRIRSAFLRANPGLHEAPFSPVERARARTTVRDAPLVGPADGRLWEVLHFRPSFFAPQRLLNIVTAVRWDEPERLILHETPWLYLGGRPRIFSRMSGDLDWIIDKQRRAERSLAGHKTGDAEFDRRWAFYVYRSNPAQVLRDPARRRWLEALAALRPQKRDEMPTISSLGTVASLGMVVDDSEATVRQAGVLIHTFAQMLDAIEVSTGNAPASRLPLAMDLEPDGTGYPSPTLRLRCTACGQEAHPRFMPDFHTEICDQCRRGFYNSW